MTKFFYTYFYLEGQIGGPRSCVGEIAPSKQMQSSFVCWGYRFCCSCALWLLVVTAFALGVRSSCAASVTAFVLIVESQVKMVPETSLTRRGFAREYFVKLNITILKISTLCKF